MAYKNKSDFALLNSRDWYGFQQGNDGYPIIDRDFYDFYFIAGGQDSKFKATAIEIYGRN